MADNQAQKSAIPQNNAASQHAGKPEVNVDSSKKNEMTTKPENENAKKDESPKKDESVKKDEKSDSAPSAR